MRLKPLQMSGFFVAVDAGGTSTEAALTDEHDHVVARGSAGPGSYSAMPLNVWTRVIQSAVQDACSSIASVSQPPVLRHIWVGSAGIDTPTSVHDATNALRQIFGPTTALTVTNDAALLCAHNQGKASVVAIAGTGSVVLAFDVQRTLIKRVGGLGWILGDDGSAYAVGRAVLRAVVDAHPLPSTTLASACLTAWRMPSASCVTDLLKTLYSNDNAKARIASLAPVVVQAAMSGDTLAKHIVHTQAKLMAQQIMRAAHSLGQTCTASRPALRLGSSLFQVDAYRDYVMQEIHEKNYSSVAVVHDICGTAAAALRTMPYQ